MEDAAVTGSATANAAEADITDEFDLTKDPGKDFSGSEAMLTTASGSVTYYETFAAASEAAQKNADSTIKLLKDVKAPGNGLNFFEGTFTVDLNGKNLTGGYATLMLVPEKPVSYTHLDVYKRQVQRYQRLRLQPSTTRTAFAPSRQ